MQVKQAPNVKFQEIGNLTIEETEFLFALGYLDNPLELMVIHNGEVDAFLLPMGLENTMIKRIKVLGQTLPGFWKLTMRIDDDTEAVWPLVTLKDAFQRINDCVL